MMPMHLRKGRSCSRSIRPTHVKSAQKPEKKVSVIAKGKKAKVQVWKGTKLKTSKGLTKKDLVKSKEGKIVSLRRSEHGKKNKWAKATVKARQEKGYKGFKPIKKGSSFYDKAKEIYEREQ